MNTPETNPLTHDWNKVEIVYCDGGSYSGTFRSQCFLHGDCNRLKAQVVKDIMMKAVIGFSYLFFICDANLATMKKAAEREAAQAEAKPKAKPKGLALGATKLTIDSLPDGLDAATDPLGKFLSKETKQRYTAIPGVRDTAKNGLGRGGKGKKEAEKDPLTGEEKKDEKAKPKVAAISTLIEEKFNAFVYAAVVDKSKAIDNIKIMEGGFAGVIGIQVTDKCEDNADREEITKSIKEQNPAVSVGFVCYNTEKGFYVDPKTFKSVAAFHNSIHTDLPYSPEL